MFGISEPTFTEKSPVVPLVEALGPPRTGSLLLAVMEYTTPRPVTLALLSLTTVPPSVTVVPATLVTVGEARTGTVSRAKRPMLSRRTIVSLEVVILVKVSN